MVRGGASPSNWVYSAGEGIATVQSNFLSCESGSVRASTAPSVQTLMHSPQSMQRSSSITACCRRMRMA